MSEDLSSKNSGAQSHDGQFRESKMKALIENKNKEP
jgi:hypothetical protein